MTIGWRRVGAVGFVLAVVGLGCSSGNSGAGGGGTSPAPLPGDRMFRGAVAAKVNGKAASGTVLVVLHDGKAGGGASGADGGASGADGGASGGNKAEAKMTVGGLPPVKLAGFWTADGSYDLAGSGYTILGSTIGARTIGKARGPGGFEATYDALDARAGGVSLYCGTFLNKNSDEGSWTVTISEAGSVAGSFSIGGTHGHVTGSKSGSSVSGEIQGDCSGDGGKSGCTVKGTAMGQIGANQVLSGTYATDYDAGSVKGTDSGSFTSSPTCSGDVPPTIEPPAEGGGCACPPKLDGCAPCGICCIQ